MNLYSVYKKLFINATSRVCLLKLSSLSFAKKNHCKNIFLILVLKLSFSKSMRSYFI